MSSRHACPYCGTSVAAEARYCDHCGTPLSSARQAPLPARRLTRPVPSVPVWLFVVAMLLLFSSSSVGGFRYTAGRWPLATVPVTQQPEPGPQSILPPPLGTDSRVLAEYRRSVVSVSARGKGGSSSGSGFLIDDKGNVVTAAHVVEVGESACYAVIDDDGRSHPAALVMANSALDVALLRVSTMAGWPTEMRLADSGTLAPGDEVYVVGSPKGIGTAVPLSAEVTRLRDSRTIDGRHYPNLTQFSGAVVMQGISGGPLVRKSTGQVEGIVIASSGRETPIAWALPVSEIASLVSLWSTFSAEAACSTEPAARTVTASLVVISPRSGAFGPEGTDLADGVALALRDMESTLRAAGYEVRVRAYDDQGSVEQAEKLAEAVARDQSVVGVVGSLDSLVTQAIAERLLATSLVMVAPTAGAEELTAQGWPHFNRLVASLVRLEPAMARFAKERLGVKAVYMVDDGSPAAISQAWSFEAGAQVISLGLVGRSRVTAAGEYTEIRDRLRETRADGIYYAGSAETALRLITELRREGILLPVFSSQSLYDPRFERWTSAQAHSIYFSRLTADPSEQFKRHFERLMGKSTRGYAVYGYDAATIILSALARYGELNPAQLPARTEMAQMVRETKGYHGHTSWVSFDSTGENATSWIYFYEWLKGIPEPRGSLN